MAASVCRTLRRNGDDLFVGCKHAQQHAVDAVDEVEEFLHGASLFVCILPLGLAHGMSQTQWHLGMKAHIGADADSGIHLGCPCQSWTTLLARLGSLTRCLKDLDTSGPLDEPLEDFNLWNGSMPATYWRIQPIDAKSW